MDVRAKKQNLDLWCNFLYWPQERFPELCERVRRVIADPDATERDILRVYAEIAETEQLWHEQRDQAFEGNGEDEHELPVAIRDALGGAHQQLRLMEYVWEHGRATFRELRQHVWRRDVQNETIQRFVSRINAALMKHDQPYELTAARKEVVLIRHASADNE